MKTRIFVLLALFVSLVVFPGLASGEAREVESAPNSAMFNPLTFVEAMRDAGLAHATSVAVSPDGKNVYVVGRDDDAVAVFGRNATSGALTCLEVHRDSPSEDGLNGAHSVTVSPDGAHVYVAGQYDHAVAVFERNPTSGALTWLEVHKDSPAEDGLVYAISVVVSPDGKNVYVASYGDDAVVVFSRNVSTGLLTWQDANGHYPGEDGLEGACSVAVSPDGAHVYVASQDDDAVAVFERNATSGLLMWKEVHEDSPGEDGLDGASSVAVSPDGAHVYVTSFIDHAVTVFSRNVTSGALTWLEVHKDSLAEDGLRAALSVVVSPDGKNVYVAGRDDNAVAVFDRNVSTGRLTWLEVHSEDGLNGARSVAVSPDGTHVYVASSFDDAVAVFGRDVATGRLTFVQAYMSAPSLEGVIGMAVSPDGKHVYAAGNDDDTIVFFARDKASGTLNPIWLIRDGVSTDGLDGARAVALDADGENVYVAGSGDDAVVVFRRNSISGILIYLEMHQDGAGADGLDGPQALAVSPDGKHVYVASQGEDAVAIFGRDGTTGMLTYAGVVRDDSGPVDGLDGAYAIAITADGKHVYVAGYVDDAVAVFERDATSGALTFKFVYKDTDPLVNGLNGANDLALSPDGEYLYVASRAEDAVAVFQRVPSTGALFEVGVWRDGVSGVDGLNGARAVAVSPDGSQVYVASQVDDALAVFARDEVMGDLFFVGVHKDGVGGVEGLDTADGLAVSPDSGHVYVAGYGDDAVAVFARWRVYLPLVLRD